MPNQKNADIRLKISLCFGVGGHLRHQSEERRESKNRIGKSTRGHKRQSSQNNTASPHFPPLLLFFLLSFSARNLSFSGADFSLGGVIGDGSDGPVFECGNVIPCAVACADAVSWISMVVFEQMSEMVLHVPSEAC